MKYKVEVYENTKLLNQLIIIATHPIQVVNTISQQFPTANRINILKDHGERIVYIIDNHRVTLIKKSFRNLNNDEIKMVFAGELMFGAMIDG